MANLNFIEEVTKRFMKAPRTTLRGNNIPGEVIGVLSQRADVFAKLAVCIENTTLSGRGANAFRNSKNLGIRGYRNFGEFNTNARQDVEQFMSGLSEEDQNTFTNKNNIVTICVQPDKKILKNDKEQIVTGKSYILPFDDAVRSEYKDNRAIYIIVMFATSVMKPPKARAVRRSKGEIQQEMIRKERMKLRKLNSLPRQLQRANKGLQARRNVLSGKISDYETQKARLQELFGGDIDKGLAISEGISQHYMSRLSNVMNRASDSDKKLATDYVYLTGKGHNRKAAAILKRIEDDNLRALLIQGQPETAKAEYDSMRIKLHQRRRTLLDRIYKLIDESKDPTLSPRQRTLIRYRVGKWNEELRTVESKIEAYRIGKYSDMWLRSKTAEMARITKEIEDNIEKGMKAKTAIDRAVSTIRGVDAETKQDIKAQVASQVVDGMPIQYATQQAIQDNMKDYDSITAHL